MSRHRVVATAGVAAISLILLAASLVSISSTSGAGLPTMLSDHGYQVRPRSFPLAQALGPDVMTVTWSSWTPTKATGAGTFTVLNQGVTSSSHVTVLAYDLKGGHFTVLRLTFTGGHPFTRVYVPGTWAGYPAWAPVGASSVPPVGSVPPVTAPPSTTGPPTITGTASAGAILSCSGGSVTRHATRVVYRWIREGSPIPGAASRLYRVHEIDEGLTITCDVIAYSGSVVIGTVVTRGVGVKVPFVSGCPAATGSLEALVRLLGATRARALGAFASSSSSGQQDEDLFCLTPVGVLVGYPPASLLGTVAASQRGAFAGRVLWISTSNAYYSIVGVRPGTPLATAGTLLTLIGPFRAGANIWYLAQDGSYLVVLIVRGGVVEQVGVADWSLSGGRGAELALIGGLQAIYRQSIDVSGPLQALDGYWAAIGARNFAGAFGFVRPGVIGSKSAFVSSEQHEHVQSAQFDGRVTSESGSRAAIRIVSLITHDEQFGCRSWSGSYEMIHSARGWLIARAAIKPRSCTR